VILRTAGLSLRLLRRGGRRASMAAALVAVGIAVGTVLLAVAFGALHGWDARDARSGWRTETARQETDAPAALLRTTTDVVAGRELDRVELAVLRPGLAPPPGLDRLPAPGEVWVSPALAALMQELRPDELAERFPVPTGVIGDAGLRGPDELVAISGRTPDELAGTGTPVAALGDVRPDLLEIYRQLTYVAAALLVFPVASLLGASARLTAARRAERLATLRLLGASTGQVTVAAVTEVTAIAVGAAVVGVAVHWLLAPALAAIPLGGGVWFAADLRLGPATAAGVVAGVAVLALFAALGGMRQVVVGPLGVVRRQRAGGARLLRLLGVAGALAIFAGVNGLMQTTPTAVIGLVFAVGVLAMFGAVMLIGPLVVRLLGTQMVRSARSPAVLLAGRRLLDDPRGAFRPLAGLTLAVFVAGFIAPLVAVVGEAQFGDDTALRVVAAPGTVTDLDAAVRERLAARGIAADVRPAEVRGEPGLEVVPTVAADRDRVRTALAPLVPDPIRTAREADSEAEVMLGDVQRGVLVVLAGTFLIAATATGTAAAARVLDHRRTLRLLRLAGTPLRVLDAARRAETLRPLLVVSGISLALGLLCASPFAAATDALRPIGLLVLAATVVAGVAMVAGASAASHPLLRSVTTAPARDD
jgi:hypothetical protein